MDANTVALILGEALKLANQILSGKIKSGEIKEKKKQEILQEMKDAQKKHDYGSYLRLLRRVRRMRK